MTIHDALTSGLRKADAEILLAYVLGKNRTWILAHADDAVTADEEKKIQNAIARRKKGEPIAYITGTKEFFGRKFFIDDSVLIPRPATEHLIENALKILSGEKISKVIPIDSHIVAWSNVWGNIDDVKTVVDIGTGSGCIAVTLACERFDLKIIATDISEDALHVAKKNAEKYSVTDRITFLQGRGLEPFAGIEQPFFIVSNPPYIPAGMELEKGVQDFEPHVALFSGEEGTDVIREIVADAYKNPFCRGFVMECRKEQAQTLI